MAHPRRVVTTLVLLFLAVGLMVVPVEADYLSQVGSDNIMYRTASCGIPVVSMLGAEPGLGGGSEFPIGGETSTKACEAASGKRVTGALVLLLAASLLLGLSRPGSSRASARPTETASA